VLLYNGLDDVQAAEDNYAMVQAFLTRFPQYRTNDLYITAESYGGHYMPMLAKQIVDENSNATTTGNPVINFKGFAVGNPATTFYSVIPAGMETFWGHQLTSKPVHDQFVKNCVDSKNVRTISYCLLYHRIIFNLIYISYCTFICFFLSTCCVVLYIYICLCLRFIVPV
jgi:carboxypeptidase C (cathepsin A)